MLDNLKLDEIVIPNETKDKIYDDGFHPAVSESGKILALVPRAIHAALAPLEQWIQKREYNIAETNLLLEQKLENVAPEKIVSPEPYVAVPAFQAIAYSMSNKELQNMYANLLAKAMLSDTQEKVHPAFVELIKQMSPNDALVIDLISKRSEPIPAATLSIVMKQAGIRLVGQPSQEKISLDLVVDIDINTLSEKQLRISLDNLKRLGLISLEKISLSGDFMYNFVEHTHLYAEALKALEDLKKENPPADHIRINKKCIALTPLGDLFCEICINGFENS